MTGIIFNNLNLLTLTIVNNCRFLRTANLVPIEYFYLFGYVIFPTAIKTLESISPIWVRLGVPVKPLDAVIPIS